MNLGFNLESHSARCLSMSVITTLYRCEILTKSCDYSGISVLEESLNWDHAALVLFVFY